MSYLAVSDQLLLNTLITFLKKVNWCEIQYVQKLHIQIKKGR